MTALAGFWNWRGSSEPVDRCKRMLGAQRLYGSHDVNCASEGEIAIGRALHRLLPEDSFDRQPVCGPDGRFLVADIRIDNREEIASALTLEAGKLRNVADAWLLAEALAKWGERTLERLVGDFAFAQWDPSARCLLLARDFLGQRPLVYHNGAGFFAFASMAKGLHALPDVPYEPDLRTMAEFTATLPEDGSRTFFAHVGKVPPGHLVRVTREGIAIRRFWNPPLEPIRLRSPDDYAEALRGMMDVAVAARLRRRDDSVGSHLSAGLDSSAVTATAARALAGSSAKLFAFTAVPDEPASATSRDHIFDEGPLAAMTARHHAIIEHVCISSGGASPLASLDRNFLLYERPILNLVNLTWGNAINAAARDRGLSVMLNGNMGNIGVSWNGMDLLPNLLRTGSLRALARQVAGLRRGGTRWGTIAAQSIGPFLPRPAWEAVRRWRGLGGNVASFSLVNPGAMEDFQLEQRAEECGRDLSYRPPADGQAVRLWALRRVDYGNYNKGALAEWGLDQRDPTADRRLIEFCLRVPAGEFLRDGVPRALARRAFADRLPQAVAQERRKGYQAYDWHLGFQKAREEITGEVARICACPAAAQVIDLDQMSALAGKWPTNWASVLTANNYRTKLLRAISNGHFLRKVTGSNQ